MSVSTATYEADLLVIGAGMGGLTAAYYAAAQGASVVVVEKAPEVGGSAALSGAHLWTAPTYEVLREQCPSGDAELGRAFVEHFPETVEWVRSSGVQFSEPLDVLFGRGYRFDILTYFERAVRTVEAAGGWVLRSTFVDHLLTDGDRVTGARVRDADGFTEVVARCTLLCTGGFQGNRGFLQQFLGDRSAHLLLRSNPWSSGDGLRLGLSVGADVTGDMATFYGHLIAWPLVEFLPKDFVRLAFIYSDRGVLLNVAGERFTDESLGDHRNTQRVAEQPTGRAVLVFDETIRATSAVAPVVKGAESVDTIREAELAGARVASAPTVDALAEAIAEWGYDGRRAAGTIAAYNEALGRDGGPRPARRRNPVPVGEPPFHAVELKPGITFTEGGLRVDGEGRVLDRGGGPVPGLLAAGADIGGVFDGGYAGGLALASVFGLRAAGVAVGTKH